jgi:hypothetical protein
VARRRLAEDAVDAAAYRVLLAVAACQEASGEGQPLLGEAAAEILQVIDAQDEAARTWLTDRPRSPSASLGPALAQPAACDALCQAALPAALREMFRLVEGPLARAAHEPLAPFGVARRERVRSGPLRALFEEVATDLGAPNFELFVSRAHPHVAAAIPGQPAAVVLGEAQAGRAEAELRFLAGRASWLLAARLAGASQLDTASLGCLVAALIVEHVPDYSHPMVAEFAAAEERQRLTRLLPRRLWTEMRPLAFECARPIDFAAAAAGIVSGSNRAGLMVCGRIAAAVAVLGRSSPEAAELLRWTVSEERSELLSHG